MFRIVISCTVILSTIIFCVWEKNKAKTIMNENCIEVYLYKEFIMPENCIPLKESEYYKSSRNIDLKSIDENYLNRLTFDTVKNEICVKHTGFKNRLNLIESKPFIKNEEISLLNNLKTTFIFSKNIKIKNTDYYRKIFNTRQFVLLLNKKPILNGYFICSTASVVCENTRILIYYPELYKNKLLLWNYKGKKITDINLKKDYPELYQTFKNTNRLIE